MARELLALSDSTYSNIVDTLEFYKSQFRWEVESGYANPIKLENLHRTISHCEKILSGYYEYNSEILKHRSVL